MGETRSQTVPYEPHYLQKEKTLRKSKAFSLTPIQRVGYDHSPGLCCLGKGL